MASYMCFAEQYWQKLNPGRLLKENSFGMQIPGCAEVKAQHPVLLKLQPWDLGEHPSHPGSETPKT